MVERTHGFRYNTRNKLKKPKRMRGKISIRRYFQKFDIGQKVYIDLEPSVHRGMPHPRYQGRTAEVVGKRKRAYILKLRDGKKEKILISYPVHLMPARA